MAIVVGKQHGMIFRLSVGEMLSLPLNNMQTVHFTHSDQISAKYNNFTKGYKMETWNDPTNLVSSSLTIYRNQPKIAINLWLYCDRDCNTGVQTLQKMFIKY